MELFYTSIKQMLILFIFIGIGYFCRKKSVLPAGSDGVIAKTENNLLMPAIIINTFISQCTISNLSAKWSVFVAGIIVLAITVAISYALAKITDHDSYAQNIYRYSFAFPNIGFMGIAVVQGVGGPDLLFDYMIFTLPYNIFIYSIGITWLLPKDKSTGFQLNSLLNPMFAAMAIGIVLGLSALPMPSILLSVVSSLSACMSPLAMILTGFVIAAFDFGVLLKIKKVYFASAIRLLAFPLAAYVILKMMQVPDTILLPTICTLAMPMGLNTIVIPTAHGLNVDLGASMALVSSVTAIITIPLIFMLVL